VQKFTRPLTREIEVAGQRLALTFSEQGLALRPVGSRKPPREVSWGALLTQLARAGEGGAAPSGEEVASAIEWVKSGSTAAAPKSSTAPASSTPGAAAPGAAHSKPAHSPS
jgi:hypothetical protein